jgi:LysM repeat protein
MNETRHEKGSVPRVIANYRKRQERAMRLLLAFWIGIMLLILGAGYVIYRFLNAENAPLAQNLTDTPTASPVATQITTTATMPAPSVIVTLPTGELSTPSLEPTEPSTMTYTVRQGDTLVSIAIQFGVGLPTLTALNPQVTPEFLSVGDRLTVPAQNSGPATAIPTSAGSQSIMEYQVVSGDTLAAIAARFGSTIDAIVRENNLDSPDEIRVGQTLRLPVEVGVTPSATQIP